MIGLVVAEEDAVQLEGEQLGIGLRTQVAGFRRLSGEAGKERHPPRLRFGQDVARAPGLVVELGGKPYKGTATGQALVAVPTNPAVKKHTQAGHAWIRRECRLDDSHPKAIDRYLEDLVLQFLLRSEVGEQPALRHPDVFREVTNRDPIQPLAARELERLVDNVTFCPGALSHAPVCD
jgi:hypothetical protein